MVLLGRLFRIGTVSELHVADKVPPDKSTLLHDYGGDDVILGDDRDNGRFLV